MVTKDIKEVWPSSQMEDIKDELGAVFKARGKAAECNGTSPVTVRMSR